MLNLKVSKKTRSEASKNKVSNNQRKILHKRKNSFSYRKKIVLHYSLKINRRGGPNKLQEQSEKNRKINKRPPRLLGT